MDTITRVPVVFGRNRLRGHSEGWMFDADSEGYADLSNFVRSLMVASGCPDPASAAEHLALKMFAEADAEWRARKDGTIAHVLELTIGQRHFLLGEERALNRAPASPDPGTIP